MPLETDGTVTLYNIEGIPEQYLVHHISPSSSGKTTNSKSVNLSSILGGDASMKYCISGFLKSQIFISKRGMLAFLKAYELYKQSPCDCLECEYIDIDSNFLVDVSQRNDV